MNPSIDTVRELSQRCSNWGRWGEDDQRGTLNLVTSECIMRAAGTIQAGKCISLGLPVDSDGPQTGGLGRFNPIHLMLRDGADAVAGTTVRDFYGGNDRYLRGTDDILILPLQCGTQWDALSHVVFEDKIYNGYSANEVSSKGARKNDIRTGADGVVGHGLLLDVARHKGVDALDPGYAINRGDLVGSAADEGVAPTPGDFVLIRTGQLGQRRTDWRDYAGGPAPGLGLDAVEWIAENDLAGIATDTWGMEVLPNETPDVYQPLHIILIVHMGLWVGEIFDLESLATDCADDGQYEFFFCAPPLPITGAVGSPVNPVVIK